MKIRFIMCMFASLCLPLKSWPPSLENCGNTCFLNATIQVLYTIEPLTQLLVEQQTNPYSPPESTELKPAAYYYTELIKQFERTRNNTAPVEFTCTQQNGLQELVQTAHGLLGTLCGSQQDATDFLWKFQDQLIEKPSVQSLKTNIKNLFSFNVTSVITCPGIGDEKEYRSSKVDPHLNLTINVQDRQKNLFTTLQGCLENYFSKEQMDDPANLPKDLYGREQTGCTKQLLLQNTPAVLLIGLKRFETDDYGQPTKKLDHTISIPFDTLDINQFISKKQNSTNIFELIGVVIQRGTLTGGHYWAYVKDLSDQWYKCDDASITKIPSNNQTMLDEIQGKPNSPTGYLLVYQKKNQRKKLVQEYQTQRKQQEEEERRRRQEQEQERKKKEALEQQKRKQEEEERKKRQQQEELEKQKKEQERQNLIILINAVKQLETTLQQLASVLPPTAQN